jgi:putative DNA primase/helicase
VDEAIRRRFHLVPFTQTIPQDERDPDLPEKLKAEWPGILAWAVQGCLEWQRIGLAPPPAVSAATEGYLADEDMLGQFLAERCTTEDKRAITEIGALFAAWTVWAETAGDAAMTVRRFSGALVNRGFEKAKDATTRRAVFRGIALRSAGTGGGSTAF